MQDLRSGYAMVGKVRNCGKELLRLVGDGYRYISGPRPNRPRFRGIYCSFRQAKAAAPRTKKIGYNHREVADKYRADLKLQLEGVEYPALFHLARIVTEQTTVLDLGGNIGTHYLRYKRYLPVDAIQWIVWDLPEINRVGRQLCSDNPNIEFVDDVSRIELASLDVLVAIGSIQYIEMPDNIFLKLSSKGSRLKHIIIDQIPLYDGQRFVTLQNGGLVYYPMHVFNRSEFIMSLEKCGFRLDDVWSDALDSCLIPFHPERSVRAFSGLYFCK